MCVQKNLREKSTFPLFLECLIPPRLLKMLGRIASSSSIRRVAASAARVAPRRALGSSQFQLNSEAGKRVKMHSLTKLSLFTGLAAWGVFAFEAMGTTYLRDYFSSDEMVWNRTLRDCGRDEEKAKVLFEKRKKYLQMIRNGETPYGEDDVKFNPLTFTFLPENDPRRDIEYNEYLPANEGKAHRFVVPKEIPVTEELKDYIDKEIVARAAAYDAKKKAAAATVAK